MTIVGGMLAQNSPAFMDEVDQAYELGSGPRHVVVVHGFTGNPLETRSFGQALAALGHHVHGVKLTGHGLDECDLERATADDWRADVLRKMDEIAEPLSLVGLSMGGMLSAIAAAARPEQVKRLVLLAPALRLHGVARAFLVLSHLAGLPYVPRFLAKGGSDIFDDVARHAHRTFAKIPLSSGRQFQRVARWGQEALPKIAAPTLVVGAINDHTVPFSATEDTFAALGCTDKRFIRLERSYHLMTLDVEHDLVTAAANEWLNT